MYFNTVLKYITFLKTFSFNIFSSPCFTFKTFKQIKNHLIYSLSLLQIVMSSHDCIDGQLQIN